MENKLSVPSVGRIVHYYSYGSSGGEFPVATPRAAIITEVPGTPGPESAVGLAVLNPTGLFFNGAVPYGPGRPGHWGWPPVVPPVALPPL